MTSCQQMNQTGGSALKMGHPNIDNKLGFAFAPVFVADQEARPLLVVVVKATFQIEGSGKLKLAEEQVPVNLAGQYWGDPDCSSYKYEPEGAMYKPATDVALIGHAYGLQAAVCSGYFPSRTVAQRRARNGRSILGAYDGLGSQDSRQTFRQDPFGVRARLRRLGPQQRESEKALL